MWRRRRCHGGDGGHKAKLTPRYLMTVAAVAREGAMTVVTTQWLRL